MPIFPPQPALRFPLHTRKLLWLSALLPLLSGCRHRAFPSYPEDFREFAYVSSGASNSVSVLDLVNMRPDRTLAVGKNPTGLAVNPVRDEIYAVNTGSDSITVINTELNRVEATIGVHHTPYFIAVAPDGRRAYVPNSGSNTVSVIDLDTRREIATAATGEGPGVARVDTGNRFLLVTNRIAGSVSVYSIQPKDAVHPLTFRESFDNCPGATDIVTELDDPTPGKADSGGKAFIACSGGHQVMVLWLAATPDSFRGRQNPALTHDARLTMLDVGRTPTHLALADISKRELFTTNFDADTISDINTWTNEVQGTYLIGTHPSRAVISKDASLMWVTDFGSDSATLYSLADARVVTSTRTGSRPDALAFSHDENLLLIADAGSSDVAVIRTQNPIQPQLVTMLPAGPQPNDLVIKAYTSKIRQ